eukprot:CAMPEP_0170066092 /NCGR_PEP_ID=MMETSP0019_2-20121128/5914_1 /TAXON_ID=98059 /ORGANISM="Dinobryon sp., Strain UTEXLB2267" /LENGTH=295 /DNA_ID=CAMNT_0010273085 /DNA_START=312 /DNA_END=1196 /DNA_ORIENTATION=-
MSLVLARAVYPNGHVYTYEFNSIRAAKAKEEFIKLGVDDIVTVTCGDVCGKFDSTQNGGFIGVAPHSADAVFLDLPEPWLALEHAKNALKSNGNICCYSPCIEQVMKCCARLRELEFHSIRMIEVRLRPYDGRIAEIETLNVGLCKEEDMINNTGCREEILHQDESNTTTTTTTASAVTTTAMTFDSITSASSSSTVAALTTSTYTDTTDSNSNELPSGKRPRISDEEETMPIIEIDHNNPQMPSNTNTNNADNNISSSSSNINGNGNSRRAMNRPKSSINGVYRMPVARPVASM